MLGEKRGRESDEAIEETAPPPPTTKLPQMIGGSVLLRQGVQAGAQVRMPLFGLGTFRIKGKRVAEAVSHAHEKGTRLFDTAGGYKNEADVWQQLSTSGCMKECFVVTKVSKDDMGSAESVAKAIARSHAALGGDGGRPLDLLLIHWPGTKNPNTKSPLHRKARITAWLELEKALKTGTARSIGVSNFTIDHLKQLEEDGASLVPAVNQVEVHPYRQQRELRQYCDDKGIHVQAYTSLGRCTEPPKVLYGNREPDHPRLVVDEVVVRIAEAEGLAPTTVLLQWALRHGLSVIPRASPVHFDSNNNKLFTHRMSDASMSALDGIDERPFAYAYPMEKVPL